MDSNLGQPREGACERMGRADLARGRVLVRIRVRVRVRVRVKVRVRVRVRAFRPPPSP